MKVLFAINSLVVGGAERVFVDQINHLDHNKFEIWLLTTVPEKGNNFRLEVKVPEARQFRLNFKKIMDLKGWLALHRFFKKNKFDAVITSLYLTNFTVRIMAKLHGVPVICSNEQNVYLKKKTSQIMADRLLAKFTDAIFAVSNEVIDFTSQQEKIPKEKFVLNYNSVPLIINNLSEIEKAEFRTQLKIPNNAVVVATAGRLIEQKGQIYLIKAAKEIIDKNSDRDIFFLIAGKGGFKEKLLKEAESLGITDKVILSGVLPINKVMSVADIFVLPSLWEGLSLVMLEAMVYGKPMVITDVSGAREVIMDGKHGFLVKPQDVAALAEKINLLINDEKLRQKFSAAVKERVKDFSIDKNVQIIENTLLNIYQHKIK